MSIGRFIRELFSRYPKLFAGNMGLAVILMLIDMATLFAVAPVVGMLTNGQAVGGIVPYVDVVLSAVNVDPSIESYFLIFVILTATGSLMQVVINYFILKAQFVVRDDMVMGTSEMIMYTSANFINQNRQGDFINTLTQEANKVSDAFTAMTRLIAPIAQVGILLAVPLYISWQLTLVSLAVAFAFIAPLRYWRRHVYAYGKEHTDSSNDFATQLQEALANSKLISVFGNEEAVLKRIRVAFERVRDVSIKFQILSSTIQSIFQPVGIVIVFITFIIGKHLEVPLELIAVVLYAFNRLMGVFAVVNNNMMLLTSLYPSYEQVMKFRDQSARARLFFGSTPFTELLREIVLDNVSYSYNGAGVALEDVSLSIPAGKMTALVGTSGAGKSTLADLILGVHQPKQGRILLDDIPMNDIDIASYRSRIGFVPQKTELFHGTIRENIAWTSPAVATDDIESSCRLAHADHFIKEMEQGYDTIVGDRGVRLSGGQLQRVALARALARKPQILVLDEASSALDSQSEAMIQQSIEAIIGKTTLIVIAHRLSTIAKADNIVVLDKGRVVEQGKFDQLMAKDGVFANLAKLQKL